jgi:hypothetical protein
LLKALLPLAVKQLSNSSPGDYTLKVNGQTLSGESPRTLKYDRQLLDAPRMIDLSLCFSLTTANQRIQSRGEPDCVCSPAMESLKIFTPVRNN